LPRSAFAEIAWSCPWPWCSCTELGYARMRAVIAVAACALVLPGCGGGAEGGAKRSGHPDALGPERLDLALSDGTIVATQDGGRRWKETFRP
jgi:hypothetical protein